MLGRSNFDILESLLVHDSDIASAVAKSRAALLVVILLRRTGIRVVQPNNIANLRLSSISKRAWSLKSTSTYIPPSYLC